MNASHSPNLAGRLTEAFPTADQIPAECRLDTRSYERLYLINGEIRAGKPAVDPGHRERAALQFSAHRLPVLMLARISTEGISPKETLSPVPARIDLRPLET